MRKEVNKLVCKSGGLGRICAFYQTGNEGGACQLRCDDTFRRARAAGGRLLASRNALGYRQNLCHEPHPLHKHTAERSLGNSIGSKGAHGHVRR